MQCSLFKILLKKYIFLTLNEFSLLITSRPSLKFFFNVSFKRSFSLNISPLDVFIIIALFFTNFNFLMLKRL